MTDENIGNENVFNNKSVKYLKDNKILKDDEEHILDIVLMETHVRSAITMLMILLGVSLVPIGFGWYFFGASWIALLVIVCILGAIVAYFVWNILNNSKKAIKRREDTHYFVTSKRVYFKNSPLDDYISRDISDIEYIEFLIERKIHKSKKGSKYPVDVFNNLRFKLKDDSEIFINKIDRKYLEDNVDLLNTTLGSLFRQRIIEVT